MGECDSLLYNIKRPSTGLGGYKKKPWPSEYIEELMPTYMPLDDNGYPSVFHYPQQLHTSDVTGWETLVDYAENDESGLETFIFFPLETWGIVTFDDGTEAGAKRVVRLWYQKYGTGPNKGLYWPMGEGSGTASAPDGVPVLHSMYRFQVGSLWCGQDRELDWPWYENEYEVKDVNEHNAWLGQAETLADEEAATGGRGSGRRPRGRGGSGVAGGSRTIPGGSGVQMTGAGVGLPGTAGHPSNFGPLTSGAVGAGSTSGPGGRGGAVPVNTEPFGVALAPDAMLHPMAVEASQRAANQPAAAHAPGFSGPPSVAWQIGGTIERNVDSKLAEKGFTQGQIDWSRIKHTNFLVDPETDVVTNTIGSAGLSPDQPNNRYSQPALPEKRVNIPKEGAPSAPSPRNIVVRAPFGYMKPDTSELADMRPQLTQFYPKLIDVGGPIPLVQRAIETFYFPYIPQNVQYQGLGSEWKEIPRAADLPIVEWSKWHLLKATMEFLIAERADGIYQSVHEEIETLRRMAQRPYPVSVYGMDQLLRISMRRAAETGKALEFVIADLSLSSLRRTMLDGDKEVTAAQVKLTLQEIPIEEIRLAEFPVPGFSNDPTPDEPDDTGDCIGKNTDIVREPGTTSVGSSGIPVGDKDWPAASNCDGTAQPGGSTEMYGGDWTR